jgi:hypothetical protein
MTAHTERCCRRERLTAGREYSGRETRTRSRRRRSRPHEPANCEVSHAAAACVRSDRESGSMTGVMAYFIFVVEGYSESCT